MGSTAFVGAGVGCAGTLVAGMAVGLGALVAGMAVGSGALVDAGAGALGGELVHAASSAGTGATRHRRRNARREVGGTICCDIGDSITLHIVFILTICCQIWMSEW